jgi:arsenate reductase (glutaredoxin)
VLSVYGITTCGTVKKARAWLDGRRVAYEWVDMRTSPPDRARITRWVKKLGAKALRNTSGGAYRALGPEKDTWIDAAWIDAFAHDAMLIKRPIIERDGEPASVGFTDPDAIAAAIGL